MTETNDIQKANKRTLAPDQRESGRSRWRATGRRALAALLIISLALAMCLLIAPGAQAASRYPRPARQSSISALDGPCSDPKISLDCLNQPDTLDSANSVQNPIADGSALFFFTEPSVTYEQPLVLKLWSIMLGAVDVCVVLMLMLNGLQIMTAGTVFRYARAIETIPGALLALIAAHVSLIFIVFIVGLNNALSVDFYNWANVNAHISLNSGVTETITTVPANVSPIDCPSNFFSPPACAVTRQVDVLQITPQSLDFTDTFQNIMSLFTILSLIAQILELMLLAQVIIRVFFIDLYIVLAPLGIACWALPGKVGQPLTRLWLRGFLSTVLTQFVQVAALIVAELIVPSLFHLLHSQLAEQVIAGDTLGNLCKIGVLWFIFRIPALLDEVPMQSMLAAGQAMSAAIGMTIGAQIGIAQTVASGALGLGGLALGRLMSGNGQNTTGANVNQADGETTTRGSAGALAPTVSRLAGGRRGAMPMSGSVRTRQADVNGPAVNGQAKTVEQAGTPIPGSPTTEQGMRPLSGTAPTEQAGRQTPASEQIINEQVTTTGETSGQELRPGGGVVPDGNIVDGSRGVDGVKNVDWIDWKDVGVGHGGGTDVESS